MTSKNHDLQLAIGKAQDATQELNYFVSRLPRHFGDCARDLKSGKPVSVENISYQGTTLKARATAALRAIATLHAMAAETFPQSAVDDQEAA